MSREEDSFRMHVHILPNERWVCNFCGYEYSGDTTRIRAHLAGVAGYGIQGCENVDSQVRSKALTAWKGKRPAKSSNRQRYLGRGPHLRATPNDEDDCIVTSFAALPDLTSDVISTVAPSSSAFLPLPETVNNEDDWTVTVARPDPSSGVMSTVNASSSAFLPLPKTNLPNQSLPPQNMNPQRDFPFWPPRPQSHAVGSYFLPRSLSHLIRVIRQPDLVSKDLTNMLRLANAKVEEPNTKVPQGTLSRDHKKKIKYGSFGRKDSLSNGGTEWRKIGKIHVSRKEIAKGSNGTIVLEGIYEGRPVAVKRLVRAHCDVASNEIQILLASDQHKNIVRYHGVEYDPDFVYLALERCACSLDDLIQVHSDSSNNSAFPGDPASTDDYKIQLDSVRGMMQDVDLWRADGHPSPLLQKLMRNVVSGLCHLHDLRIIHRDLKPQNVLITKNRPFCAQLSDMGISKCLPKDKSSLGYPATDGVQHPTTCVQHVGVWHLASNNLRPTCKRAVCGNRGAGIRRPVVGCEHLATSGQHLTSVGRHLVTSGCGTLGWRAPELLLHGGRQTPAMDAFSLGCVLCFCFTRGRHPFGENLERDHNIVCNKMDLSFVDIPEAHDLFSCLLNQDPKLRPKTSEVLHHPFFWSSKMRMTFLHDVSDEVESEAGKGNSDLLKALDNIAQLAFDGNWIDKIDKDVMDDLHQHRRKPYDGSSVRDLLRVVRNKFNHLKTAPEKVKEILGSDPNGLDAYFAKRFPRLLMESYKVVSQNYKREKLVAGVLSK